MDEFINLLIKQFRFLVDELGFEIIMSKYDQEYFGDPLIY